jgi:minor histocompatibility antigen H13
MLWRSRSITRWLGAGAITSGPIRSLVGRSGQAWPQTTASPKHLSRSPRHTTLGVMMVWNHAQPALLYLVPGVLGSLWLTALARGELDLMWSYTEDIGEEEKSKDKKKSDKEADDAKANATETEDTPVKGEAAEKTDEVKRVVSHRPEREVFSFSIEAPWKSKQPQSVRKGSKSEQGATGGSSEGSEKHSWVPAKNTTDIEPAGKRVRLM